MSLSTPRSSSIEQVLHITPEERSTLQLLAAGKTGTQIAARIGSTERELEQRLTALFARMGVATTAEAVNDACRRGLLTRADDSDEISEAGAVATLPDSLLREDHDLAIGDLAQFTPK